MDGINLDEIPKYIRYDFLMTLLGLICVGVAWYFSTVGKIESTSINIFVLYLMGFPIAIWGFGEMYNSYKDERDLRRLQVMLEKRMLFIELRDKEIIDNRKLAFLINTIKDDMKDIIVEKREETKQQPTRAKSPAQSTPPNQPKPPILA